MTCDSPCKPSGSCRRPLSRTSRMVRDAAWSAELRDLSTRCPAFCRACSTSIAWRPGISVRRRATSRSVKYLIPWQPISPIPLLTRDCGGAWSVRGCSSAATRECSKQCCAICCRTQYDIRIVGKSCSAAGAQETIFGSKSGIAALVSRRISCPKYFRSTTRARDGAERGGFGLGLAIVRRIGEVLDHRIDVRSTPGKGTVLSIEVPRGDSNGDAAEKAQTPIYERVDFPGVILAVEDEATVRASLSRMLKMKGIDAIVVATADDALAKINRQEIRPDLLLCDYNLRGSANGVDTVNALRAALGWNVPAIVMTGDIRSEIVDSIAAQGISVLIKPFSADELYSTLHGFTRDLLPAIQLAQLGRIAYGSGCRSAETKTRQDEPPRWKHQPKPDNPTPPRRPASCRRSSSAWRTRRRR